jgi:hypothetical protein
MRRLRRRSEGWVVQDEIGELQEILHRVGRGDRARQNPGEQAPELDEVRRRQLGRVLQQILKD